MSLPDYAALTRDDPNPVKRWLQRRRLDDALALLPDGFAPRLIVDYGAGDGELALRLTAAFPGARVVAFEPTASFALAARRRLGGAAVVVEAESDIPPGAELIVCAEVFEHLPEPEEQAALARIAELAAPGGLVVIGVPIETGPPALAKGLFRMARRRGEEDASWRSVWCAAKGAPPEERATVDLDGRPWHPSHLGFDQRAFEARLARQFEIIDRRCSPLGPAPAWASAEQYLLLRAA